MNASRPSGIASIAIRLASEGIPIGPISRALKLNGEIATGIVIAAHQDGLLREVPPPDWPDLSSSGRAAIQDVSGPKEFGLPRDVESLVLPLIAEFRLTLQQGIALAMLTARGACSRTDLFRAMVVSHRTSPKLVDVIMCKLRRALDPECLSIDTIFGQGYAIDADVQQELHRRASLRISTIRAGLIPGSSRQAAGEDIAL